VIALPQGLLARAIAAGAAASTARGAYAVLAGLFNDSLRWNRINHRGEPVNLLEGPALVVGSMVGLAVAPGVPARLRGAGIVAALGCGALGAYDDLAGSGDARGLRGHLRALLSGEMTTGAVKVLGIGATGLVVAALAGRPPHAPPSRPHPFSQRSWSNGHDTPTQRASFSMIVAQRNGGGASAGALRAAPDVLLGGAVVASLANLVNLFDLRPGRAIKVGLLLGGPALVQPGPAGVIAAAPLGTAAALANDDLGERSMLGDCGANALGALIGVAVLARYDRIGRLAHLIAATGLTLASEKVSFTRVIEQTPVLQRLDAVGRRPPASVESPT
jgi:UDP-GlcNAc:undecaprenyl-phosphate/decaprenyl-phosphate GlcNAc-1-phosphate transferase